MNVGKTIGAMAAGCVLQVAGMYLIHDVWLKMDYQLTASLWRTPADINHGMWALMIANVIYAVAVVLIYIRGVEHKPWVGQGIRFGILLALVTTVYDSVASWVTMPVPHSLPMKWVIGEGGLCILLGLLVAAITQPKSASAT
jgi:hypothetical protein